MDGKALGARIKAARREQNMTGEKLSEACNINATYLRQIEAGTKTPSLPMFVELCNKLRVSPAYLLEDSLQPGQLCGTGRVQELLKTATPTQTELVYAMLEAAVSVLNK